MTGMLFDTGPLKREAILKRFRRQPRRQMSVFNRETREFIIGTLHEAERKAATAGVELCECGLYDESNEAADLMDAIQTLRLKLKKLQTVEEDE